jgi:hypothetical protein
MLRKSGIMINLKKIPAAVYEDNTFQLFLIYGGGRESLDTAQYEATANGVACRYPKTIPWNYRKILT